MAGKIVVFGAGATGRGHVGLLAWLAGFEIVFVDKKSALVDSLAGAGRYLVRLPGERAREIAVAGYRVYHSQQRRAIAEEIADAVLVLTAVFDQNLADVARTLAQACELCAARPVRAPELHRLRKHGRQLVGAGQTRALAADRRRARLVRRPGRISGLYDQPRRAAAGARSAGRRGRGLQRVDRAREAFRGEKPAALTALELVDNQAARLERKLFLHNGGHAVCGYVGYHRGHRFIHEAVADSVVAEHVVGAMEEIGQVVEAKWEFSHASIEQYQRDFCRRGAVAELRDEILRVARDPIRKLAPGERLLGPAVLAVAYGLPRRWICRGIVAALRYRDAGDPQSVELAQRLAHKGLRPVLEEVCGLGAQSSLAAEIEDVWRHWKLESGDGP